MKKKAKVGICWCILSVTFIATGFAQQDTLIVVSYNIYHAEHPQENRSTVQEIADLIIDIDPYFVSLQEVDSKTSRLAKLHNGRSFNLADSLAQLTSMTGYFGKALDFDGGGYGVAILSRKAFASQKLELPNPEDGEPRVMFYIDAETNSGVPLIFAATHLDHQSPKNRLAQVEAIRKWYSETEKPVILAGDFNFVPGTEEYGQMNSQWIDAALQVDNSDATYPTKNPAKRIDYIWLSKNAKWKVLDFQTVDVYYSDHLPVVAKVVVYPPDKSSQ